MFQKKKMRLLVLWAAVSARALDEEYPSHKFCALYGYEPVPYEKILPDMGLLNAWPKVANRNYVPKVSVQKKYGSKILVGSNSYIERFGHVCCR